MSRRAQTPGGLNDARQRFVLEYLKDLNAAAAYKRTYHKCRSDNAARVQVSRLLASPKIQAALAAKQAQRVEKADLSAARVLEELRRLAFIDPKELFDESGNLLPIHEMSPEARACIAGFEVARSNLDKTDGKRSEEWLHKIKQYDKTKALEMLAKHFKLLTDVVEIQTSAQALKLLDEGRARNAKRKKP